MRTGSSAGARWIVIALASLGAVLASVFVSAQTYQGGIRGVVKDVQGIVPGVEVTLVNEATNAVRSVTTNEVGEYSFPSLVPATYTIRVVLAGFKTEELKVRERAGNKGGRHVIWMATKM